MVLALERKGEHAEVKEVAEKALSPVDANPVLRKEEEAEKDALQEDVKEVAKKVLELVDANPALKEVTKNVLDP